MIFQKCISFSRFFYFVEDIHYGADKQFHEILKFNISLLILPLVIIKACL